MGRFNALAPCATGGLERPWSPCSLGSRLVPRVCGFTSESADLKNFRHTRTGQMKLQRLSIPHHRISCRGLRGYERLMVRPGVDLAALWLSLPRMACHRLAHDGCRPHGIAVPERVEKFPPTPSSSSGTGSTPSHMCPPGAQDPRHLTPLTRGGCPYFPMCFCAQWNPPQVPPRARYPSTRHTMLP